MESPPGPSPASPVPSSGHDPVLLAEVLTALAPELGKVHVDCTTGRGGHAQALATRLGPTGQLICLDAVPRNLEFAHPRLSPAPANVRFFQANFPQLPDVPKAAGVARVDGLP